MRIEQNRIARSLGHGFTAVTYDCIEDGKKYYIVEIYKNGEIQYFDEEEIKG